MVTAALELVSGERADIRLIIGKENSQGTHSYLCRSAAFPCGRYRSPLGRSGFRSSARQTKPEARTFFRQRNAADAAAPALDSDAAKVQSQARFSASLLPFHEESEDLLGAQILGKARAVVINKCLQKLLFVFHANGDARTGGCIAQGVFQKIRE